VPKYVMRCGFGPVTCLVWLGWMRVPDEKTALRRSGHALQNMLLTEVAHPVMDHAKIYWEGEPDFYFWFKEAKKTRNNYETWKNQERMEEMISVSKPKPDFATNKCDVIVEVIINSSQYDYIARIRISAKMARRWFLDHELKAADILLLRAKKQMLKGDYKGAKIWYRLDKPNSWLIKFIDVVDKPKTELPATSSEPTSVSTNEQLSLLE